jgi:hypothetical protein
MQDASKLQLVFSGSSKHQSPLFNFFIAVKERQDYNDLYVLNEPV